MELSKLKGIIKLIEDSSLKEFTYEDGEIKLTMSKLDHAPVVAPAAPMPPMMPMMPPMGGMPMMGNAPTLQESALEDEPVFITSPIVGTFYSAPSPEAPAFVHVGDQIKNGTTVCILEAMKLMNEIQCEWDCQIEAVLVSNEQKVEYGQPLFRVKRL